MPYYILPIEEIDESVKRPMVATIAQEVVKRLALPTNLPVMFKGQANQVPYNQSSLDSQYSQDNNRYQGDAYITLDYTEEDNEQTLLTTAVDQPENRPIVLDNRLGVRMTPVYMNKRVTINITLSGTANEVSRWRANIRRHGAQGVLSLVHSVPYHYPIPMRFMYLLVDIHTLRETIAPYGQSLSDYLNSITPANQSQITTLNGKSKVFVIKETQTPIQGWSDFGIKAPNIEKDEDTTRYALSFSYTYYYDCPESITMRTNLTIHNQMLPMHWINLKKPYELEFLETRGSYSQDAFNEFKFNSRGEHYRETIKPGIAIPYFDDWIYDAPNSGYETLASILLQVDVNDPTFVVDLNQLDPWQFTPEFMKYIKLNRTKVNAPNQCVVNLQIQEGDVNLLKMNQLTLDENGLVRYATPLNPRLVYHLVISININPTTLNPLVYDGLTNNGCFFKQWISSLYPEKVSEIGIDASTCTIDGNGDVMTTDEVKETLTTLGKIKTISPWYLVSNFTISTKRMQD